MYNTLIIITSKWEFSQYQIYNNIPLRPFSSLRFPNHPLIISSGPFSTTHDYTPLPSQPPPSPPIFLSIDTRHWDFFNGDHLCICHSQECTCLCVYTHVLYTIMKMYTEMTWWNTHLCMYVYIHVCKQTNTHTCTSHSYIHILHVHI